MALAQEQNKATLNAAKMGVDGRIDELKEEYRLKKELSAQEHEQKLAEIKAQNAGIATKAQIDKDAKTTVADTNERAASQKSLLDYDAKIEASKQKTATT